MDRTFFEEMPKIELHAHLNGSLKMDSIKELGLELYGENSTEFLQRIHDFTYFDESRGNCKEYTLDRCFQKFSFMHELTSTRKGLQLATEMVVRDFALDNVIYLEIRTTPKMNDNMTREEYLEIILQTIQTCIERYNIRLKLLISIDRSQGADVANDIIHLAISMRNKYPGLVKGVDLSGNPKKEHFRDFAPILKKAKIANLKLALHCAEVNNEMEAQEMLDFDFERCGHGTYLTAQQIEQCMKQNITIECCLTSNVKCGTVENYDVHHFGKLLRNNVKTVLCTDDSGVFDCTLSTEYIIAYRAFGLNKDDFYNLSINAIEASFSDPEEKNELRQKINTFFKNNNK